MTICTIDERNFNLNFTFTVDMAERKLVYEITAWDKVNHKIDKYVYKEGEFETACNKFDSLKIGMKSIRNDEELLADLQAEQKEQM